MISTYCVMCVYIQEAEKFPRVLLLKVILICDVTQESMIFISIQKTAQKTLTIKPNQTKDGHVSHEWHFSLVFGLWK